MNQHYRAHARKLGQEVLAQVPPSKQDGDFSDDDDDFDDDESSETPQSRTGASSSRHRGAPMKDESVYSGSPSAQDYYQNDPS